MDTNVPAELMDGTEAQQLAAIDALLERIDERLKVGHARMDQLLLKLRAGAPT